MEGEVARTGPPRLEDFPDDGPNSLASIGQRAVATFLDWLITSIPVGIALAVVMAADDVTEVADVYLWVTAGFVATWSLYEWVCIWRWGSTLGSWAMGYRVARWSDGKRPDAGQSALRALLPATFMAIPVPVLNVGWVFVFLAATTNPLRRGFHDLAGGTVVIRTR